MKLKPREFLVDLASAVAGNREEERQHNERLKKMKEQAADG